MYPKARCWMGIPSKRRLRAMQTLAGVGENTLSKAKVTAADGTDVTKNYEIVCECGRLEVFPRPITVRHGQ